MTVRRLGQSKQRCAQHLVTLPLAQWHSHCKELKNMLGSGENTLVGTSLWGKCQLSSRKTSKMDHCVAPACLLVFSIKVIIITYFVILILTLNFLLFELPLLPELLSEPVLLLLSTQSPSVEQKYLQTSFTFKDDQITEDWQHHQLINSDTNS